MNIKVFSLTLLLVFGCTSASNSVFAQSCPHGIISAGNPFCVPPSHHNQPYFQSVTAPAKKWKLTWGAIASDKETGDIGVSVGKFSKSEARKAAMANCEENGSENCKIDMAYENQCAAIAWPWQGERYVSGLVVTRGGPTVEDATEGALTSCSSARSGRECRILYSDCSKPVLAN